MSEGVQTHLNAYLIQKKKIFVRIGGREGWQCGNLFMGGSMLTCLGCYVHSNITLLLGIPVYFLEKEGGV